jgi:6-phosphogluconolactonase
MAKNSITWNCFNDFTPQSLALAQAVEVSILELLEIKERVVLCVPGGTTPAVFFQALSHARIDWSRITVVLNDERWVPLDHPQSNESMLRKNLHVNAAKAPEIISFYIPALSIEEGVNMFNQQCQHLFPLDICVLGMGVDGHTASLFPDMEHIDSALNRNAAPALIVSNVPNKEPRVSLNLSALLTSNRHYLLVRGSEKKRVIEQAMEIVTPSLPVSYVIAAASTHFFYAP